MAIFSVAGIQMPIHYRSSNLHMMLEKAHHVASVFPWTNMIVFSELAPFGPSIAHALSDPAEIEAPFIDFARRANMWVCPGSFFVRVGDQVFNQAVVIDPNGVIVGRYNKMFPFLPYETGVEPGMEFLVFDVPHVGRFGLSICYDIWFPETTRTLVSQGVEVLIHPVLTGTTDRDAEIAIARATAAMFQCYVVDVNGLEAGGVGRSLVADPCGRIAHQAGQASEIFPVELDLGLVRRSRATGAMGLGQTLKSFRDHPLHFSVYDRDARPDWPDTLGPLAMRRKTAASTH